MDVHKVAIERMVECLTLIDHYTAKGAMTLLGRKEGELATLVKDWGTQAYRVATELHSKGAKIQTPV